MNNDFFDIDSILEEFSSYSAELSSVEVSNRPEVPAQSEAPQGAPVETPREAARREPVFDEPAQEPAAFEDNASDERSRSAVQSPAGEPFEPRESFNDSRRYNADEQLSADESAVPSRRERRSAENAHRSTENTRRRDNVPPAARGTDDAEPRRFSPKLPAFLSRQHTRKEPMPEPELFEEEYEEEYVAPEEVKPAKLRIDGMRRIVALVFAAVAVLSLCWLVGNIHPGIGISETMRTDSRIDLVSKIDVFANNSKSDALGDLAYVRKIYTIDRSAPCGPKPNPDGYITYSIGEAEQVMELVNRARSSGLLEGQDVIFDPSVDFYHDSDIQCYLDDTILVICWKELIDGRVCSCVEVKIADASQFRRKLTEDYYGSSVNQYTTQMAASVNAVTAMNADYYMFRTYGIVVYQGEVYRYETSCDTLFIDENGDFSFMRRFDNPGQEATQQFVYENHIQFSLSFGPVLIENGEVQHLTDNYGGLGEMNMEYSRAAIGQYDTLHYLYMAVSHSNDGTPRATVNQFADIIATKNLRHAYNLDGGQTGEVVFNGKPYNHIDFGNERLLSDCIYFCTAIPESEVNG